jgi:hypothetical protein
MEKFWRFILFEEPDYTTNVSEKHLPLPLPKEAFDLWLVFFVNLRRTLSRIEGIVCKREGQDHCHWNEKQNEFT